jgi:hypothetical protein
METIDLAEYHALYGKRKCGCKGQKKIKGVALTRRLCLPTPGGTLTRRARRELMTPIRIL